MAKDNQLLSIVPTTADQLIGAVEEMRRKMPAMIEHQKLLARLQREAYVAYLTEGFTASQALELTKAIR